jgi:hypothetical protein
MYKVDIIPKIDRLDEVEMVETKVFVDMVYKVKVKVNNCIN